MSAQGRLVFFSFPVVPVMEFVIIMLNAYITNTNNMTNLTEAEMHTEFKVISPLMAIIPGHTDSLCTTFSQDTKHVIT